MPTYRYGIDADYVARLTRRRPRPSPTPGNPNSPALIELFNGAEVPSAINASVLDTTTPNAIELMDAASPLVSVSLTVAGGVPEEPPPSTDYVEFTLHKLKGSGATHHRGALALPLTGEGMTLTDADIAAGTMRLVEVQSNGSLVEVARTATSLRLPRLDGTLTSVFLRFDAGTMTEGATKTYRLYKVGRTLAPPTFGALPTYTRTAAVWDWTPDTVAVPNDLRTLARSGIAGPFKYPTIAEAAAYNAELGALDAAWALDAEAWQDHTKFFSDGTTAQEAALSKSLPTTTYWISQGGEGAWQAHVYLTHGFYDTPMHYWHRFVRSGDPKWFKLACAESVVLLEEGYKTRNPQWGHSEPYRSFFGIACFYEFTGHDTCKDFLAWAVQQDYAGGIGGIWTGLNYFNPDPNLPNGVAAVTDSLRQSSRILSAVRLARLYKLDTLGYLTINVHPDMLAAYKAGLARMQQVGDPDLAMRLTLSGAGQVYSDRSCNVSGTAQPDGEFVNSFMIGLYMWEIIEAKRTLPLTSGEIAGIDAVIDRLVRHLSVYRHFFGNVTYTGFTNAWNYDCFSIDANGSIPLLNHFYAGGYAHAASRGVTDAQTIYDRITYALASNGAAQFRQWASGPVGPGNGSGQARSRKQWNEMSTYLAPYMAMRMGDV